MVLSHGWADRYTQVFEVEKERVSKNAACRFFYFKNCNLASLWRIHQFCSLKTKNEVQMRSGERLLLGGANLFNSTFTQPYKMLS